MFRLSAGKRLARTGRMDAMAFAARSPVPAVACKVSGSAASLVVLFLGSVLFMAGCGVPAKPQPETSAVRIVVEADGIYEVTASALRSAGFDPATTDPSTASLSAGGQPVAFQVIGEGSSRSLRFYGQALKPDAHTAQNVYWLEKPSGGATQAGPAIQSRSARLVPEIAPTTVVSVTVRAEEQKQWVPKAGPGADHWVWQTVFAPGEARVNLALPHPAGGEAFLSIRVWGNSSAPVDPDHHWILSINGTQIADPRWDGLDGHVITTRIPAGLLRPGDNELTIRAPGDTGAPVDSVFLDWAEIIYQRELIADGPELTFAGDMPGYAVTMKETPIALWDISDPAHPVSLKDHQVEKGLVRFDATAGGAQHRFAVVAQEGVRQPASVKAAAGPNSAAAERLRNWPGGADLVIVTTQQFRSALEPLIKARQAQGLRVAVMDVDEVYDAFSYGRVDPVAIRDMISHAVAYWTPPAPRFALLAGDASYDPRGYLKGPEADLVPTYLIDTEFSGWTASDVWFALPSGAGLDPSARPTARPLLAIGRLPAQTAEQVATMVAKALDYEKGDPTAPWRHKAFLAADDDDPGFAEQTRAFAAALVDYDAQVATVDKDGAARAAVLKAFADGTGLIGYIGHGSLSLWAQEKILSVEDMPKLTNRDKLPVVMTLTCLSGFFSSSDHCLPG